MTTCADCGGPIIRSTVGSGFSSPVWVHRDTVDWVERPHDARPAEVRVPCRTCAGSGNLPNVGRPGRAVRCGACAGSGFRVEVEADNL